MSEAPSTIRLQAGDGSWETLGADRLRGIAAEDVEAKADDWGPSTMTFTVKAMEGTERPDIAPFTPAELEVDGIVCWAGFVWERPSEKTDYRTTCRGWQYHLDDDLVNRVYVHTRLADYRDQRSFLNATLANFTVAGKVESSDGVILLGWGKNDVIPASAYAGVTLDLGPDSTGRRIVIQWESSNNDAGTSFFARGTAGDNPVGGSDDAFSFTLASGASGTTAGTLAADRRYVHLFIFNSGGGVVPNESYIKIKSAQVFRSTAYESGNASILKSDTVIKDVVPLAPQLNQDTSLITAGTFSIPDYTTGGYQTPRQAIQAVNTYENYRTKLSGADLRTLRADPKPTTAQFEVGEWSGHEFTDSSVTGDEIYDKVIAEGSGPDGAALRAIRGPGDTSQQIKIRSISNQYTDALSPGGTSTVTAGTEGITLRKNIPYGLRVSAVRTAGTLAGTAILRVGTFSGSTLIDGYDFTTVNMPHSTQLISWVPTADRTTFGIQYDNIQAAGTTGTIVGTVELFWGRTLLERRNIARAKTLDIRTAVTQTVLDRFGDLWLGDHMKAPFVGTLNVFSDQAVRKVRGGQAVAPHVLLLHAGERIRLSNRVDPETGYLGRDGRIAGITYRPATHTATIDIDDRRSDFERLLERYGALVGTT